MLNGKPVPGSSAFGQVLSASANQANDFSNLYVQPKVGFITFGAVRNTIGSSRTIEMSLHFAY